MNEQLKDSYSEVNQILKILGNPYKERIPKKLLYYFKKNQNIKYHPKIDKNFNFSRNTLIIMSILNYKYFERDEQKLDEYKKIYDKNEFEYQKKINSYKEHNWLNKKNYSKNQNSKENELIISEKKSIWKKILNIIKKCL